MAASQADWATTKVNATFDGALPAFQFSIVKRVVSATTPSDGKIHVEPITAATDKPYGVIQENARPGGACTVIVVGGTKIAVGASAVSAGADVATDTDGKAVDYVTDPDTWDFGVFDIAGEANSIVSAVVNGATPTKGV